MFSFSNGLSGVRGTVASCNSSYCASWMSIVFLILANGLAAQETVTTASITGRVVDATGANVARAEVSVMQLATNQFQKVSTDPQGRFRLPYLAVGRCEVAVRQPGFGGAKRLVQLAVGSASCTSRFAPPKPG